ncbi:tricarboxylic transporter [Zobellella endophytica]|uniref:Tricarboxylic transporter n=1 Tax=Zobellella endophytica TaxID=2116700 RepID=A0A2P7R7Z1_9GAMM|nr:tripartite tricarboxylate transporter substrate binding protein [Zobellella endophytica]PSJ46344.1 tricarboxylic transporter [Zobellella endophytica]
MTIFSGILKKRTSASLLAALLLPGATLAAEPGWQPSRAIEYIAPANPGGGWDTLARTTARVIMQEQLSPQSFATINVPGGGGAVAWAQIARDRHNDHKLFATSPPLILVPLAGMSRYDHEDFTPIARLITDSATVLVRKDSPYQTLNDLLDALRENPRLSIGGGSAPGSLHHVSFAGLALAAGLNAREVNYVSYSGGGEAIISLLGGHIEAVSAGIGESSGQIAESGQLRALGIAAEERLPGTLADIPTYKEQGVDYTFDIWRGVMGPKEMPADAVAYYQNLYVRMMNSEGWQQARDQLAWTDAYLDSQQFGIFLDQQKKQFGRVLAELGLLKQ